MAANSSGQASDSRAITSAQSQESILAAPNFTVVDATGIKDKFFEINPVNASKHVEQGSQYCSDLRKKWNDD